MTRPGYGKLRLAFATHRFRIEQSFGKESSLFSRSSKVIKKY
jgi:hypothetical protein